MPASAARRRACAVSLILAIIASVRPASAARPRVYVVTGATIVASPGRTIQNGTLLLRDGLIEAAGEKVSVPDDAVTIDGKGLFVYPALIDAGGWSQAQESAGPPATGERMRAPRRESDPGPVLPVALARPEKRVSSTLQAFDGDRKRDAESWRRLGFGAVLIAPTKGVFRGTGTLVLLEDDVPVADIIVRDDIGSHIAFETNAFGDAYPTSVMGAAAAMRQTLLDAQRYQVWTDRYAKNPAGMRHPERLPAMEALRPVLQGTQPLYLDATHADDIVLADRIAREFKADLIAVASGTEAEIADQIAKTGRVVVYPARIPDKPRVDDADDALDISIKEMTRYLDASSAPKVLHDAGVKLVLSAHGLKNTADFPANVRKIVEAGLPEDVALAALTTEPARCLGVDKMLGSLDPGKIANVIVTDGPIFAKDTKVKRVFVDGTDYPVEEKSKPKGDPNAVVDPRGTWSVVLEIGGQTVQRTWTISGTKGHYTGTAETRSGTVTFDKVELAGNALTVTFPPSEGRGANEVTVIVAGESFEGSFEMGPRTIPVKGTRTHGPEGGAQ